MFPKLIDLGTVTLPLVGEVHLFLPTYGLLFATSVLLSWWWFSRRARTLGVPDEQSFNMCFYGVLAGILGAKGLLILLDWRTYLAHPGEIWGTLRSGGVLLGGVICASLVFVLFARRHRLPLEALGDAAAAPLALAQAIGRLGCFFAGCCWGAEAPAESWYAVTFTNPDAHAQTGVPLDVPLFPVQAVQAFNDLLLAGLLTLLWRRRPRPAGTVFWVYVLLYSTSRGLIEFWRGDAGRGLWFAETLSTSQLLSVGGVLLATAMLLGGAFLRHKRPAAR